VEGARARLAGIAEQYAAGAAQLGDLRASDEKLEALLQVRFLTAVLAAFVQVRYDCEMSVKVGGCQAFAASKPSAEFAWEL